LATMWALSLELHKVTISVSPYCTREDLVAFNYEEPLVVEGEKCECNEKNFLNFFCEEK
jgi:hypothetical protein